MARLNQRQEVFKKRIPRVSQLGALTATLYFATVAMPTFQQKHPASAFDVLLP
jgi:hypothetical protein